jgi:hypothetical protein
MTTNANPVPALPFEGVRRTMNLSACTDRDEPGRPDSAVVQALAFDADDAPTVHVYVNESLSLDLTPTEAHTLAAMLSHSAGELDGRGPSAPAMLRAA